MKTCAAALVAALASFGMALGTETVPRGGSLCAGGLDKYKALADETLKAFKSGDLATAKKKAKDLEKAWDSTGKTDLGKKQELWKEIDAAMDEFIDPILKEEKPDAGKVEAGYKDFVARLAKAA